jgi:hypothetical protein
MPDTLKKLHFLHLVMHMASRAHGLPPVPDQLYHPQAALTVSESVHALHVKHAVDRTTRKVINSKMYACMMTS